MQLGMVGLGRMGANIVRRLMHDGHECVVWTRTAATVQSLAAEGAIGAADLDDFVARLTPPRVAWVMVPAAATEAMIEELASRMSPGDTIIDGGNSYYHDDIRRAKSLAGRGIHYVDIGTSGGVFGLERGFCLMVGGEDEVVARLDPLLRTIAPGMAAAPRTPGRSGDPSSAEQGYLHCGPAGAGHFVKMVHNGIEYGIMAAYAEGFNILSHANIGRADRAVNAEGLAGVALVALAGDVVVGVPGNAVAGPDLHHADAPLDQPPRREAVAGDVAAFVAIEPVEPPDVRGLRGQVGRLRDGVLHPRRKLVTSDPGGERVCRGAPFEMDRVDLL